MAQNDGPSQTKTIAQGLDQTPQYANTYRNRLIEAQMIYTPRTDYVDFNTHAKAAPRTRSDREIFIQAAFSSRMTIYDNNMDSIAHQA